LSTNNTGIHPVTSTDSPLWFYVEDYPSDEQHLTRQANAGAVLDDTAEERAPLGGEYCRFEVSRLDNADQIIMKFGVDR
jgi:hypothetical protein